MGEQFEFFSNLDIFIFYIIIFYIMYNCTDLMFLKKVLAVYF